MKSFHLTVSWATNEMWMYACGCAGHPLGVEMQAAQKRGVALDGPPNVLVG